MEPGDLLAGRFELVHRASSGGMAAVYFARDRSNDAPVAIKVLHEHTAHEAARFVREGQLLAQLQHPGIVRYVGHGTTREGAVFLAMEWLDGEDLARRLKGGPLSVAQTAQLGQQAAEALGVAHAAGVIHRDLKPSNLFLVSGSLEHVKLLDFGIARPAVPGHSITATGAVVGTPGYMAPEQARSAKRVDPRADVFSLGCVLYRCIAGRDPFGSGNPMAVLLRVVLEEPPRLDVLGPSVPKAFADLVARMMAKAPEERPVDGTAVAVALGRIRPELGPAASTPIAVPPSSKTDPRRPTQRGLGPSAALSLPAEPPRSDRAPGPAMAAAPALAARIATAGAVAASDVPAGVDSKAWARRAPPSSEGAAAPAPPAPPPATPSAAAPTPSPPIAAAPRPSPPIAAAPRPSSPAPAAPPRPSSPATPAPRPSRPAPAAPRPSSPAPAAARPSSPAPAAPRPSSPAPAAPRPSSPAPAAPRPSSPSAAAPPPLSPLAQPRPSAPALTTAEQRVVCLVLARPGEADVAALAAAAPPTLTGPEPDRLLGPSTTSGRALEPLFSAVSRHGGRLDRMADDSLLVTFPRASAAAPSAPAPARVVATDEAARAARCALAIRPLLSHGPVALVAGRAEDPDRIAIDEAIDRGVHLLDRPPAGGIWVDDMMAGLLDLRFEVVVQAEGLVLRAERSGEKVGRTLLGKVTPCVGRDAELDTLLEQLGECASGRGARAVLVTGPPGVGKSRLRDELARQAARRGEMVQIWHARGEPTAAGAPFGMMATALREAFGIAEGDGVEARQHKLWARLSRSLRGEDRLRVALFLGELVGAPFPDERSVQLAAARRDMRLMGDQIRRACEDLVSAECSAMPLLFVVEDLQWGDWPTMVLFETLLRNLPRAPLMLLGLGRPEVRERFAAFVSAPSTHIIELGALSREACIEIGRAALGDGVPPAELGRLADRSGGNAFFLEELVRAVAAGKGDELPATVVAMVEARLEGLQPSERHVLRAAALLGPRFSAEGIRVLVGEPYTVEQVTALLELLAGAELLVRLGEAGPSAEYAFRQDLVRQAAYSMLTAADRELGHRLAGDWLERSGRREALVLAEHFEKGQEPARAVPWYLQAAEQALRGDDLDAAIERAERGVGCGARGEKLGCLRQVQAEALAWRGELRAAEARAGEAVKLLPAGSAAWCAAVGELARACGELGNHERLVGLAHELSAALGDKPPTGAAARAVSSVVVQLLWAGKMELADPLLEQLDRAVDASDGDPATVAHVFRACGARAMVEGDAAAALELTRMVMRCCELVGDLRDACIQRGNCGAAYMELGAWAEAETDILAALETAARLGLDTVSALAKLNLCATLGRQGRIDEGRSLGLEALAAYKVESNPRLESTAHVYLAEVLTLAGDLAAARRHGRAAVDTAPPGPSMAFALAARARVELAAGSAREALSCAEQAMALLASVGGMDEGESMLRLVWAEALSATGRHDEARRAIAEARNRLLGRAEKIASPEWRRSFLERVGENARTLSLARVWLGESDSD